MTTCCLLLAVLFWPNEKKGGKGFINYVRRCARDVWIEIDGKGQANKTHDMTEVEEEGRGMLSSIYCNKIIYEYVNINNYSRGATNLQIDIS